MEDLMANNDGRSCVLIVDSGWTKKGYTYSIPNEGNYEGGNNLNREDV